MRGDPRSYTSLFPPLVLTMAATDTSKVQKAKNNGKNAIMHVKGENEQVSLEQALEALRQAQALLDAYRDPDAPWQDPVILLNQTAAALDEAALATRHNDDDNVHTHTEDNQLVLAVRQLSEPVIQGHQAILDATQQVVAGTRPAELWNPNTLSMRHTREPVETMHSSFNRIFRIKRLT